MDPEARPDIDYLMTATTAVGHGTSIPPYELSAEAKWRRSERVKASTRRQALLDKQAKKAVVPTRAPVQLDPNSAAARRLAAKRGVRSQQTQSSGATSSSATSELNFGNFSNFEKPVSTTNATFEANFDFDTSTNGNAGQIQSAPVTSNSANDMFFNESDNFNKDDFGDDGFGGGGQSIQEAGATSQSANDMFFSDSDGGTAKHDDGFGSFNDKRDDGFSNFDSNEEEEFSSNNISAAKDNVTADSFFDSAGFDNVVKEQHSPFKTAGDGFGMFGDDSGENENQDLDQGFSNLSVEEEVTQTHDFFQTESSNTAEVDLFSNTGTSNNQGNFDLFVSTEEPQQQSQQQQSTSFQPPQNDPFDMFSSGPAGAGGGPAGGGGGGEGGGGGNSLVDDIFASSNSPVSPRKTKAASVMQIFDKEASQVDPFANMQQQQRGGYGGRPQQQQGGYGGYPQQGSYGGYQQQQGGYGGQYQQQQYGSGGVRQVPPSGQRDPFGSLMGSLK